MLIAAIVLAIALGLGITAYIAISSFLTPTRIRAFTQKTVSDAIQQPVEIGGVRLKLGLKIGINVDAVRLLNPSGFPAGGMLSIDRVTMNLKLLPLLKRRIVINSLDLDGLEANIIRNRNGQLNLIPLIPGEAKSQAWSLSLSSIGLHRARVAFRDEKTGVVYSIRDINEQISFTGQKIAVDGHLTAVVPVPNASPELKIKIKNQCTYDTVRHDLEIKAVDFEHAAIRAHVAGQINKFNQLNLKSEAGLTDLNQLTPLLPAANRPKRLAGAVQAKLDITGTLANPQLQGKAELSGVAVEMPGLIKPLENINGVIIFNGSSLSRIDLLGQLAMLRFKVTGEMISFKSPVLNLEIRADGDLKDLKDLVPENKNLSLAGPFSVSAVIKGPAADLSYRGEINISNGVLNNIGFAQPLTNFRLQAALQNNAVRIKECAGNIGSSDFRITGTVTDFKKPIAQVNWTSTFINLDEILPKATPGASAAGPPLPLMIQGTAQIKKLQGLDLDFSNITSNINYDHGVVDLRDCNADAFDGRVRFDLFYNFNNPEPYRINSRMENLSTKKILFRFFKCDLIEGQLSGAGNFQGNGFNATRALANLSASGNVKIFKGAFRSFPFILSLLDWMGFKNRPNMDFDDLNCSFKIDHGRVNVDNWVLASSMGNFLFNGTLGLTGTVDMKISIIFTRDQSDLLKQYHGDWLLYYDQTGRAVVDLIAHGKLSAPSFSLDQQKIKERLKGQIKNEFDIKKKEFEQKLKDLWKKK